MPWPTSSSPRASWRTFARVAAAAAFVAVAPGCSVLLDTSAEQCSTNADCASKGAAFADTVCSAEHTCVFRCTTNSACIARAGGAPAICHRDDGTCAALLSQDCPTVLADPGDLEKDAAVLGILMPQTGQNAPSMVSRVQSIELARREIQKVAGGVPGVKPEDPRRPLVFVSCTDADDPVRAANHLAREVRVPAIVGPAFSGVTTTVATEVTIPAGALVISPSATSPTLSDLADGGLVWRTAPPDTFQAVAMSKLIATFVEPEIRATYSLTSTDRIRLAVVHKGDAYGLGLANALFAGLVFNGKSPAANGDAYQQIDYGDPQKLGESERKARADAAVTQLVAFKPHVLITIGTAEAVTDIFGAIEATWPASASFEPRHVVADGLQVPELLAAIGADDGLRHRVYGTIAGTSGGNFDLFKNAYLREFKDGTQPDSYAAGAYDAAYLLAFAVAVAGEAPHGKAIDAALRRTAPASGRVAIKVGPGDLNKGFGAMTGAGIDFDGASGPLDFDVEKGEAAADIQIWCVESKGGTASGFRFSGAYFSARTAVLESNPVCP